MTHYHLNNRLDDAAPQAMATDKHLACIEKGLQKCILGLLVGHWQMESFVRMDSHTATVVLHFPDDCGIVHTLSIALWECSCSDGEVDCLLHLEPLIR